MSQHQPNRLQTNGSPVGNSQTGGLQSSNWPCPIKLNLFLHFTGQREDGYHLLQSYFQLLDFGDQLQITTTQDGKISFSCDQKLLNNENNLVVKAAHCLKKHFLNKKNISSNSHFHQLGAKLYLIKKSPVGGGVGGGSSDCATALLVLNQLWKMGLSIDELALLGGSLGADVPIFVRGQSAFVEGIGEKITPFELPEAYYLVIQPACHIATNEIFSNPLLTRNSKAITIRDLKALGLPYQGLNTMQTLVVNANKEVKEALDWLKKQSNTARMTGSGSCIFSVFDNRQEASKIAALCNPNWTTFVARGVKQSNLHKMLNQLQ